MMMRADSANSSLYMTTTISAIKMKIMTSIIQMTGRLT